MSFHMLDIVWADEWNHTTCIYASWAFWPVLVVAYHFAFALCCLQIFCQSLLFHLIFLGWMILPFVPQLFLPMPGIVHLSYYYFFYFWGLFYYFYTHVTVIQPMYKLLFQLPIDFLCSYILWWLFYVCPSTLLHFHLPVCLASGIAAIRLFHYIKV